MADLEYSIGINSRGAERGLQNIQNQVDRTNEAFGRLKGVIAGFVGGAFIQNTFAMANSVRDLSAALDLSIQSVLGFSQAIAANGGTIDRARDGITDFVRNVGEAANGSRELQSAFQDLGVSLDELATLSQEDLLRATINGLSELDDVSRRTAIAQRLFGESVKGVDLAGVARDIGTYTQNARESADAIDAAGEASQNFKNAFVTLQVAVLEALGPLSEFAAAITRNQETVKRWIEVLVSVASAFAVFKGIKIIQGILGTLTAALARATSGAATFRGSLLRFASVQGAMQGLRNIRRELVEFPTIFRGVARETQGLSGKIRGVLNSFALLGRGLLRFIPVIGQLYLGFELLAAGIKGIFDFDIKQWIADATNSVKEFFGFVREETSNTPTPGPDDGTRGGASPSGSTAAGVRDVVDALAQERLRIDDVVRGYQDRARVSLEALQTQRDQIGLSQEQIDYQNTINTFTQQYQDQLRSLRDRKRELMIDEEKNAELISYVEQAIARVTEEYNQQLPAVQAIAAQIREQTIAAQEQLEAERELAQLRQETERALERANDYIDSINKSTRDAQREFQQLNMDPLERQIDDIRAKIGQDLQNQIETLLAVRTDANAAEIDAQIERIRAAANRALETQEDLARRSYEHQRTFSYGWRRAFEEYRDNATNAARRAEEVFGKTTKGLEDLIVNFAKTGKFEFRGFVEDMLETLLRSNIQQVLSGILSPQNPVGGFLEGILGPLGNVFGGGSSATKGQSASNPLYVVDVSGGGFSGGGGGFFGGGNAGNTGGGIFGGGTSGGGIFSGITNTIGNVVGGISNSIGNVFSGISNTVGNVVSGIGSIFGGGSSSSSSGGGFFSGITNTVKKIGSSIGNLFGGFFATGGPIPAGRFGVVGERGPELVSGPGMVTPLNGLGANVTLNINAVDAQSFKELVARDPQFIAAVAQKGLQAIPNRR